MVVFGDLEFCWQFYFLNIPLTLLKWLLLLDLYIFAHVENKQQSQQVYNIDH